MSIPRKLAGRTRMHVASAYDTHPQDIEAAEEFLNIFGGTHTFQTFDDNSQRKHRQLARILHGSFRQHRDELRALNRRGAGIFFAVNEMDGSGRRLENIVRHRSIWQDNDENWRGDFPLDPSISVLTSQAEFQKTQSYWLCSDLTHDGHSALMNRMVASYGCDRQARDAARVLRIPGFYHRKREPQLVRVIGGDGVVYTAKQLLEAFPPIPEEKRQEPHTQHVNGFHFDGNDRLREALSHIPSEPRDNWVKVGMALKKEHGESAFAIWEEWSRTASNYDARDQRVKWNSFRREEGGVGLGSIFMLAKEHGWSVSQEHQNSNSSRPRNGAAEIGDNKGPSLGAEPVPLIQKLPPAEEFPIDALGPILGGIANALHQTAVQSPLAICGTAPLAAASLATQAHRDIVLPTGQQVPLSLYFLVVAFSGERKSATDAKALEPVRRYEKSLREDYENEILRHKNEHDAWESERSRILKPRGKEQLTHEQKRKLLAELGQAPIPPKTPITICGEPTFEGLVKVLRTGQPSMGLFTSEAAQLFGGHSFSEEACKRTGAGLNRLWDDGTAERVRAGEEPIILYNRRFSMFLQAQPEAAYAFLNNEVLRDIGLLSRVLITAPDSRMGERPWKEVPSEHIQAIATYGAALLRILKRPYPLEEGGGGALAPGPIHMDQGCRQLWIEFHNHIETQLRPDGALREISGFANKLPEHAARIAGVLAAFEDIGVEELTAAHLQRGIQLASYYGGEALRLQQAAAANAELVDGQRLLDWLANKWPEDFIAIQPILQLGPGRIRDAKTAKRLVSLLEEYGWLTKAPNGTIVDHKVRQAAWQIVRPGP